MNKITLLPCLVNNSLDNTLPIYVERGFPVALVVLDLYELDLWILLSASYHAWRYVAVGIKPRASCKLGKYSLNWATPRVFKLRCFLKIDLCYSPWSALELAILLSQPEWWNNGCAPPCLLHFGYGHFYIALTSSTSVYIFQQDWRTACQWSLYRDLLRGERRDLGTSGLPTSRLAYLLSCTGRKAVFSETSILSDTRGQQIPFHGNTAQKRGVE